MKKLCYFWMLIMLASCSNYLLEEEEEAMQENLGIPLTLNVRSGSDGSEVTYPIDVFIFDESGNLVNESIIESKENPLDVHLSAGNYTLSAFTGLDKSFYTIPKSITNKTSIVLPKDQACKTALQHGGCSFHIDKKTTVSVHLSYIVTSLEFKFTNVPSDATSVEVGVSPSSTGFTLNGDYNSESAITRTVCQRQGDYWTAGPLYILPSQSDKTRLTLTVDRPSGSETLSYTYTSQLQAAQPYRFSGKYNEGVNLNGTFEVEGWKPGIDVVFDFTENGEQEGGNDEPGDNGEKGGNEDVGGNDDPGIQEPTNTEIPTLYCSNIPAAGEFWNGFYVWKCNKETSTTANAILLSKTQWFNILASDGLALLDEYVDANLSHWRIFTKEEAHEFNEEFANTITTLNKLLRENDQDEFYFYNKERYLCDDCKSAFNVSGKISLRAAGKTTKYYMRGIKDVKFIIK